MGKAPAFQFYPSDWLSDTQLRMCSPATRGIWIDFLCYMWESPEKGKLSGSVKRLSRLVGVSEDEFLEFLEEMEEFGFGDVTKGHDDVTLINRRMHKEFLERENARLRKQRQREKQSCPPDVTPPSSSSSSSSTSKDNRGTPLTPLEGGNRTNLQNVKMKKRKVGDYDPGGFEKFWGAYPRRVARQAAVKGWNKLKPDPALQAEIITDLTARARDDPKWVEDGGQFIPHPSTYLNGARWKDEWRKQPGRAGLRKFSPKTERNIENAKAWIESKKRESR